MPNHYDFSKGGSFRPSMLQLIRGFRGQRVQALTRKQILEYFDGTLAGVVDRMLDELVSDGQVRQFRRGFRAHDPKYGYELTAKGKDTFERYVRDGACHTG